MSIIIVDVKSRTPIYEQIIASVSYGVIKGLFKADEALPSVRALASELAINPNTIQKAYAELERKGIVYSVPGKGNFISSNTKEIEYKHRQQIVYDLKIKLREAIEVGVSEEELLKILKEIKEGQFSD